MGVVGEGLTLENPASTGAGDSLFGSLGGDLDLLSKWWVSPRCRPRLVNSNALWGSGMLCRSLNGCCCCHGRSWGQLLTLRGRMLHMASWGFEIVPSWSSRESPGPSSDT